MPSKQTYIASKPDIEMKEAKFAKKEESKSYDPNMYKTVVYAN